jgi:hypothetical protein
MPGGHARVQRVGRRWPLHVHQQPAFFHRDTFHGTDLFFQFLEGKKSDRLDFCTLLSVATCNRTIGEMRRKPLRKSPHEQDLFTFTGRQGAACGAGVNLTPFFLFQII